MSSTSNRIILCSDFSASLNLTAKETDNYSVDNHAAICIVYLL